MNDLILKIEEIKQAASELFESEYPEVESAYLFGSYSRQEATERSDVDILVVCPPMGMRLFGIAADLEDRLHKEVDLHTHRQLLQNEVFLKEVLRDCIKIYEKE